MVFMVWNLDIKIVIFVKWFFRVVYLLVILGKWIYVKEIIEIGEGKLFCFGNLRVIFGNFDYDKVYI